MAVGCRLAVLRRGNSEACLAASHQRANSLGSMANEPRVLSIACSPREQVSPTQWQG